MLLAPSAQVRKITLKSSGRLCRSFLGLKNSTSFCMDESSEEEEEKNYKRRGPANHSFSQSVD